MSKGFAINLEGVDQFHAVVAKFSKRAAENLADAINDTAAEIEANARQGVPVGPTGNLRRSVRTVYKAEPGKLVGFVAVDRKMAPHAHLVEFGTVKMQARPFFYPAAERGRQSFKRRMKQNIKRKGAI